MGMTNDDSVKQKLLDSLAEEPTMVIATATIRSVRCFARSTSIHKET